VGQAITTLSEAVNEVHHSKLGTDIWQFCCIHGDIVKSSSLEQKLEYWEKKQVQWQ
jgi:hypothetical protein